MMLRGEEVISREMCSMSRFFQWARCMVFLDFQFMRLVFLAIVRATRRRLWFVLLIVDVDNVGNVDKSPRRQSEGDNGMRQPMKCNSYPVTFSQKCLMGVQCQVA